MDEFTKRLNFQVPGKHGKPILADIFIQDAPTESPVVIFSHGFKGFKDWGPFNIMARRFAEAGFTFLKFNFAYNGTTAEAPEEFSDLEAFAENNFTKELDDLDSVITWIFENEPTVRVDPSRVFLAGHSRGAATSIIKACEDDRVKAVAAWAPVAEFTRHITSEELLQWKSTGVHYVENARTGQQMPLNYQLYHDFMQNHRRLNILNAVNHLKVPLLLIHGSNDETVPFLNAVELYNENPAKCRLLEIKEASHTFGAAHPHVEKQLPPDFELVMTETIRFFHSR